MISHYYVTFKGHRCALVNVPSLGAAWLLRRRAKEEAHQFVPVGQEGVSREETLRNERKRIRHFIDQTEIDRDELVFGSTIVEQASLKRLMADAQDRRKRGKRWRIVSVHRGRTKK